VLLQYRPFESWVKSWEDAIVQPQKSWLAWLSCHVMEPLIGVQVTSGLRT
jgi:hypothetical protein